MSEPVGLSDPTVASTRTVALIGNPNVGKTSVFNRLTNLRAKTSNFAGTTVEKRVGSVSLDGKRVELIDLPGLFSLEAHSPDERVSRSYLEGGAEAKPDAILIVVSATNLERSLFVAGQALEMGFPCIVAVNMIESARSKGIDVDIEKLADRLRCKVVAISARTGEGFDALQQSLLGLFSAPALPLLEPEPCTSCSTCPYAQGHQWAASIAREVSTSGPTLSAETSDRVDNWLTHPVAGMIFFAATMLCLFALVFWLASYPMDWLDGFFGQLSSTVGGLLPAGDFNSLITDGIIGGVGGVIVFLPQICILFFVLTMLEDSGYLSRAVVVVDRWMRRVGLPGQAFVPLLAAHACAIPAIMATKSIENRRDRLAAILVIPLMTCSARLPVYSMVAALLFPDNPIQAAILFASAYALGMVAAFCVALVLKLTILPGNPSLLILDLPPYRRPSFRNAARTAYERGFTFVKEAGTVILMISMVIWLLSTYPKMPEERLQQQLAASQFDASDMDEAELDRVQMRMEQEYSLIGRAGKLVEPVFRPLGFDWKTSVGVLSSFAAREVVVSTLSVLYGLGDEPEDDSSLREKLVNAKRDDGTQVFDKATCVSLLVFFVLAMQCLPTQAVTRRETGTWNWALFQLAYMTILAYVCAFAAHKLVGMLFT